MMVVIVKDLKEVLKNCDDDIPVTLVIGERWGYVVQIEQIGKPRQLQLKGDLDDEPMYRKIYRLDGKQVEQCEIHEVPGRGPVLAVEMYYEVKRGDWVIWEEGVYEVKSIECWRTWRPGDRVGLYLRKVS